MISFFAMVYIKVPWNNPYDPLEKYSVCTVVQW